MEEKKNHPPGRNRPGENHFLVLSDTHLVRPKQLVRTRRVPQDPPVRPSDQRRNSGKRLVHVHRVAAQPPYLHVEHHEFHPAPHEQVGHRKPNTGRDRAKDVVHRARPIRSRIWERRIGHPPPFHQRVNENSIRLHDGSCVAVDCEIRGGILPQRHRQLV